ncbi:osmoprotectant NAGGN system M42 family peptidase [Desulfonatronovibrio hydrogenovorans]|uniref:osmoprotectant NAGGN system M42 family peptidase n=1 Tax=Desulfonatronovibrio hydrogenovorans TaxID=53245 RepID=UPI00068C2288|nr:osmoprotectant NAGGN system M42 family peptidase [Desulfonatronovibrio hydrogenovorans]
MEKKLSIDMHYLKRIMSDLLNIPSPTGYTDKVVHFTCNELDKLGLSHELTRRGAIRADIKGARSSPDRAVVAHLDTLGAMVTKLKPNGRLSLTSIGTWSSRFAEGARVSIFTDFGARRGTILPLKASGHAYDTEIDSQPVSWDNVEVRVDEDALCREDLENLGINVGDWVAVDSPLEISPGGYVNARHLDNKAGVAVLLAAAKAVVETGTKLPIDCHLLFTISEEVGSGASAVLHGDVAEMVSIDNAPIIEGRNRFEKGVTLCIKDSSGPFDYHLTHLLIELCQRHKILHQRDVFRYYRCDAASAIEAGNDLRTALACFGVDASHGHERTHLGSLESLTHLLTVYMQSPPVTERDRRYLGPINGFTEQPLASAQEPEAQSCRIGSQETPEAAD